ncbi:hypothetical protein PP914_gp194 [Arthrobacter phage Qui]|uniref:Uncharacterized protein n=1 Tax=Arthrobacter phage Qui TaxID=2603260 RepID=A0A5B8WM37_9CAUD|nr:hypothetical protein PP914_gp194 [Arthrobacter phage Qui]QED11682.1 hypothetical protein SEA_QUI_194 [Arthrobacter phage Qui]QOC56513.1 hypothetical protein SEA_PAELLA_194 [Arthrobacter phage Paella]
MAIKHEGPLKIEVNPVRYGQPYIHNGVTKISDGDCVHMTIKDKNHIPIVNVKLAPDLAMNVADLIQVALKSLTGERYRQY